MYEIIWISKQDFMLCLLIRKFIFCKLSVPMQAWNLLILSVVFVFIKKKEKKKKSEEF